MVRPGGQLYDSLFYGEDLSLDQALACIDPAEHRQALNEFARIDEAEGVTSGTESALGDWSDGVEDSK